MSSVYDYLDRMEKAALEIEESKEPIDAVIVLWWGLDGLRLNEDGTMEWISRRESDPLLQLVKQATQQQVDEYMLCRLYRTIDALDALKSQAGILQI